MNYVRDSEMDERNDSTSEKFLFEEISSVDFVHTSDVLGSRWFSSGMLQQRSKRGSFWNPDVFAHYI